MQLWIRPPLRRKLLVEHESAAALHHVEGRAYEVHVFAHHEWPRREWERWMKPLENAVLASHVVGARRDGSERRAAQDGFPVPGAKQIGQVGMTGGELFHLQPRRVETFHSSRDQEVRHASDRELLVGADGNRF